MIQLIYGKKGTGKSKKLLDMANAEVESTKGDIVYIDDDSRYVFDLKHEIRFVNTCDYAIDSPDKLYGLICGMMAQDYDISAMYIDGVKNIVKKDANELENLLYEIEKITEKNNVKIYIVLSGESKQLPEFFTPYLV